MLYMEIPLFNPEAIKDPSIKDLLNTFQYKLFFPKGASQNKRDK